MTESTRRSFVQACLAFVGLGGICGNVTDAAIVDKPLSWDEFNERHIRRIEAKFQSKIGDMRIVREAREWGTEVRCEEFMLGGWDVICKSVPSVNRDGGVEYTVIVGE